MSGSELTVAETAAAYEAGELALVDVREQGEWDAGHVEGAQFLPMSELPGRLAELPQGRLAIICRTGSRSGMVADWLAGSGVDAVNVTGGMKAWVAAGLPIEPADGWIA